MKRTVSTSIAAGLACVVCALVVCPGWADSWSAETGGTLAMMDGDTSVAMQRWTLNVDVYWSYSLVRQQFILHNEGAAEAVTAGFAVHGGAGDGSIQITAPRLPGFRMRVDGRTVRTKALHEHGYGTCAGSGKPGTRWETRRVHFRRGQTRVVHVSYRQRNGSATDGQRRISCSIGPAYSWHGSIGELMITYRWREDYLLLHKATCGRHWDFRCSSDGRRLSWAGQEIEPGPRRSGVGLSVYAGWPVAAVTGTDERYAVRATEHGVEIPVTSLIEILGGAYCAKKTFDAATETARLEGPDGLIVELQAGSTSARVGDIEVVLPSAPCIEKNEWGGNYSMWCVVEPFVEALGGSVVVDPENQRVTITPP